MTKSGDPTQRAVYRIEAHSGQQPGASAWVASPGQSAHFVVPDRKMTSGHHMSDAGVFVRSCSKSRGWVIRSLSSRKLVLFRNAPVVRDPNTPHAQLALNDDFIGRHGSFGPSPGAYRASARALFATHLR